MKRSFSVLILIPLLIAGVNSIVNAQETKITYRVKVNVTANEDIKNSVSSYINRELRSLRDVEIIENSPEWELDIAAFELKAKSGILTGYAVSVVFLENFQNRLLVYYVKDSFKETVENITTGLYHYHVMLLHVCAHRQEDLKGICNEIVTDFDTKYLENNRKFYRRMQEILKKK